MYPEDMLGCSDMDYAVDKEAWQQWKKEIAKLCKKLGYCSESIKQFDWEAWRDFFDDGYTPQDAIDENESSGY